MYQYTTRILNTFFASIKSILFTHSLLPIARYSVLHTLP